MGSRLANFLIPLEPCSSEVVTHAGVVQAIPEFQLTRSESSFLFIRIGLLVLSVRPKITDLNFHVFARTIHPELFNACGRRVIERENYRLILNITTAGHLIEFTHDDLVLTEVSATKHQPLPQTLRLVSRPIEGVHTEETEFGERLTYHNKVQFEGVSPKMLVTIQQQLDESQRCEGLLHRFESNGRMAFGAVSYINVQAFNSHVKIRSFHTFPDTCAVMKSESKFSIID